jgi:hypothetical protein
MTRTGSQSKDGFQEYVRTMSDELGALRQAVQASGRRDLLPLDHTYESIDRVEDFFRLVLDGKLSGQTVEVTESRVARYLGQTLVDRTGARWELAGAKDELPGQPCVKALPHLGKFAFFPHQTAKTFRLYRTEGSLRDETEPLDLARLRERTSRQLRELDREIETLRADVQKLLGTTVKLDLSLGSIALVERAAKRVQGREAWRAFRSRSALYIGEVARRHAGSLQWALCEDPVNAYFGHLRLREWSPTATMEGLSPKPGGEGVLERTVQGEIDRALKR